MIFYTLNSDQIDSKKKLLAKIRIKIIPKHHLDKIIDEKFNVESLWNNSYQKSTKKPKVKIKLKLANNTEDVNKKWNKIKSNMEGAATEALRKPRVILHKRKSNTTQWFKNGIKENALNTRESTVLTEKNNKMKIKIIKQVHKKNGSRLLRLLKTSMDIH